MKRILFLALLLISLKSAFSQDMIYLTDGTKIPGKVTQIDANKVIFRNLANPSAPPFVRNVNLLRVAFNPAGDFIVFNSGTALTDKEISDFMHPVVALRAYDILVDPQGKVLPIKIAEENETEIAAYNKGVENHYIKAQYLFLIRKNGTHQFFVSVDKALPFLAPGKSIINDVLSQPQGSSEAVVKPIAVHVSKSDKDDADFVAPDMALFGTKALQKTKDFTDYLVTISNVTADRASATKGIDLACGLFLNDGVGARVEVSNIGASKRYLVRDYLNRLMIKSGQYDKVSIEYANINYASKFKKGPDGNYYGSVTFVQKFQGFVDGNLVYGDQTTRNVTIVIKHYEKAVNGQMVSGWDVFLDDIGITETKKI